MREEIEMCKKFAEAIETATDNSAVLEVLYGANGAERCWHAGKLSGDEYHVLRELAEMMQETLAF